MEYVFALITVTSFVVAAFLLKKSFVIDAEAERNRPAGTFVQAYIADLKRNGDKEEVRVTFDMIIGQKKVLCHKMIAKNELGRIQLGKQIPVIYNEETRELILNPTADFTRRRNHCLAAAVFLVMCGSYLAVIMFPILARI